MSKDKLGDRMKGYESISKSFLTKRMPTIIRVDGKAFHTFTRGFKKPFDNLFQESMISTAKSLLENIQGCKMAYVQSDEISLVLTDYDKLSTDSWFGKNVQKMVSISASMSTLYFNQSIADELMRRCLVTSETHMNELQERYKDKILKGAMFDSRVWNLTKDEVCNYFIWRQQDCTRNAINMVAQSFFSSKALHGVNNDDKQEMLFSQKGVNFNNYPTYQKRGTCIYRNTDGVVVEDREIPIFTKDRYFVERFVYLDKEEK